MAKDYNIDDILSEVKQRRAEQESNLKSAPAPRLRLYRRTPIEKPTPVNWWRSCWVRKSPL